MAKNKKPSKSSKASSAKSNSASKTSSAKKAPKKSTRGLGRGLSALMSDVAPAVAQPSDDPAKLYESLENAKGRDTARGGPVQKADSQSAKGSPAKETKQEQNIQTAARFIAIDRLMRNPAQPRRHFDTAKLEDLTRSIQEKGILQPILARPIEGRTDRGFAAEHYQIVAGERRWQAAIKAGLHQMPVMVRELSDQEVLEIGVVENVQRANLNPIEEAMAYKALVDEFGRRQDDVAKAVGKSRSHVTNMMRLLTLPDRAQDLLAQGKLTAGHARAVISAPDPSGLAEMIVEQDLSVRQAEDMVRRLKKGEALRSKADVKDPNIRALEKDLTDKIGLRVDVKHKNPAGQVTIHYKTSEQLEDLIRRLPEGFK